MMQQNEDIQPWNLAWNKIRLLNSFTRNKIKTVNKYTLPSASYNALSLAALVADWWNFTWLLTLFIFLNTGSFHLFMHVPYLSSRAQVVGCLGGS